MRIPLRDAPLASFKFIAMSLSDGISLAIAIFTALAACAACWSAKLSNKVAADSHRQAEQMNAAILNAAKANAPATRIEYFQPTVQIGRERGWSVESRKAHDQQEHLVYQPAEILDKNESGCKSAERKLAAQQTD